MIVLHAASEKDAQEAAKRRLGTGTWYGRAFMHLLGVKFPEPEVIGTTVHLAIVGRVIDKAAVTAPLPVERIKAEIAAGAKRHAIAIDSVEVLPF
jgi:hypothetical protein